jgi:hypothetical protein
MYYKEDTNKTTVNGGIGFVGLLTIVFIALRLTGYITWPWIWVLAPLWIGVIFWVLIIVIVIAFFALKR